MLDKNECGGAGEGAAIKSPALERSGFAHGFFLRTGGVSEGLYASLNCGRGSVDERASVEENRIRVARALSVASAALIGPHQIHSAKAVIAHAAWEPGYAPHCDAVVTNVPGLAVSVLTADCVPLLLADAQKKVVAAVHAGWKGAKAGVIESTIEAMESLGVQRANILAAIGPSISLAAYEVGPEFKAAFLAGDAESERHFSKTGEGRIHFDLPGFVKLKLERLGVASVWAADVCTYKNESILFSYRRSCHRKEADYGRQISAILCG